MRNHNEQSQLSGFQCGVQRPPRDLHRSWEMLQISNNDTEFFNFFIIYDIFISTYILIKD